MKRIENTFNPYNDQFNTLEGWSKILENFIWWKNQSILKPAPTSILENSDRLIDFGKGKKLYSFQQNNGKLWAFPEDGIGSSIEIRNDQIYLFCINTFLKCLAVKSGFNASNRRIAEDDCDYEIGDLFIGDKKIIWICSFNVEGFRKYKVKPYFERIKRECIFILLSDCIDNSSYIKDDGSTGYISLPFNSQSFEIDFHKFIKRESGFTTDEARGFLKDRVVFFIDNALGRIYYKNKLIKIQRGSGKGTQTYKFFMKLLKNPSQDYSVEQIVNEFLDEKRQDLPSRGRDLKRKIKKALQEACGQSDEVDKILSDIKTGNIKLNLPRKKIFFF